MNSVLLNSDDITMEIKEMVKNIDNLIARVDIYAEIVKKRVSLENSII